MRKMKVEILTMAQVIHINKQIVSAQKQKHVCLNEEKIDSALAAAFYPGNFPFRYGSVARVAGAICYFLTKAHAFFDGNKRTAGISATIFLELNGYEIVYPWNLKKDINHFADIIDQAAASHISKDDLIEWFDQHTKPTK
jgi:death-on-curing family protein